MGLFDRFLRKDTRNTGDTRDTGDREATKPVERPTSIPQMPKLNRVQQVKDENGRLFYQLDYYDKDASFKQMYDTTRIVVDAVPTMIAGHQIYSAKVSWYGKNDAVYLDPQYGDMGRRNQFTDIKLGLDVNKFFSDPAYQAVLMRQLLDKNRIERYISQGLEDSPKTPCGNYIGHVGISSKSNSNEYRKIFSEAVGREVHYSHEMLTKREEYKQYQEQQRQAMMARKQAEIERLQKEIDDLSK